MNVKIVHTRQKNVSEGCEEVEEVEASGKIVLVDRKVDTYLTLKELVLKEFFGSEYQKTIDANLFRLRAYNVQFKILLDTY